MDRVRKGIEGYVNQIFILLIRKKEEEKKKNLGLDLNKGKNGEYQEC